MPTPSSAPVQVLYFVGTGRSGTTIVNSVLGQVPGCFAAGELRYLWQRGVGEDHRCGCGLPFSRCPTWQAVMGCLRAGGAVADEPAVGRRLLRRLRILNIPSLLLRRTLRLPAVPPTADDATIGRLYRAVAEVTGAALVVDSSKLPTYALLLDEMPDVEVTFVHLVRDPRATAFSWRRHKPSGDRDDGALMQRQPLWKSSLLWSLWNLLTVVLWPDRRARLLRVRYEDFVEAPREVMARICALTGLDPADLPFVADRVVRLGPTHAVAGNPNRHDSGLVELRADDEWRSAMRPSDRLLATLLTAPGLIRFGYPLRVPPAPRAAVPARPARSTTPQHNTQGGQV